MATESFETLHELNQSMFEIPVLFPLRSVSDDILKGLVQVLWNWDLCEQCQLSPGQRACSKPMCPGVRWIKLKPFFEYYKNVTANYLPDIAGAPPALRSHQDLFAIIQLLKENPYEARSELTSSHYDGRQDGEAPSIEDQKRAFNLALRVMTMMTCSVNDRATDILEAGLQPVPWTDDMSWTQLLSTAFANAGSVDLPPGHGTDAASRQINNRINARRLIRVARLRFIPTDELRHHLRLNQEEGTVEIFHHTAFLKESLMASRAAADGHIPRQLATEVLDSIQKTLFPSADARILLRSLISKHGLDPDCLQFEPSSYQIEGERAMGYRYLSSRLVDLYEELHNPTPRGFFEQWLERRSRARHMMIVTLWGVAIAILLGALGLAVAIFQAWVGWQQWQHPVG